MTTPDLPNIGRTTNADIDELQEHLGRARCDLVKLVELARTWQTAAVMHQAYGLLAHLESLNARLDKQRPA